MTQPPRDGILHVSGGDIADGIYEIGKDTIKKWGGESFSNKEIIGCELVVDTLKTEHTGSGRVAGGLVGLAVAGPLGAVAGLIAGGKQKIDETRIFCTLIDGRSFYARCSRTTAAKIRAISALNGRGFSSESVSVKETSKKAIKRVSDEASEDIKCCPICAEFVKRKAKMCRFCGHAFEVPKQDLVAAIPDEFLNLFKDSALALEMDLTKDDLKLIYSILFQIENAYASLSERYSLKETSVALDEEWFNIVNDKELTGERAMPDSVLSSHIYKRIGSVINRKLSAHPKKVSDKDLNAYCLELLESFGEASTK
jgi:hypothetical protein